MTYDREDYIKRARDAVGKALNEVSGNPDRSGAVAILAPMTTVQALIDVIGPLIAASPKCVPDDEIDAACAALGRSVADAVRRIRERPGVYSRGERGTLQ